MVLLTGNAASARRPPDPRWLLWRILRCFAHSKAPAFLIASHRRVHKAGDERVYCDLVLSQFQCSRPHKPGDAHFEAEYADPFFAALDKVRRKARIVFA